VVIAAAGVGDYGSQHSIFYVADYRDWFGRDFSFLIELFNKCEHRGGNSSVVKAR
jgi:hypothetical protein